MTPGSHLSYASLCSLPTLSGRHLLSIFLVPAVHLCFRSSVLRQETCLPLTALLQGFSTLVSHLLKRSVACIGAPSCGTVHSTAEMIVCSVCAHPKGIITRTSQSIASSDLHVSLPPEHSPVQVVEFSSRFNDPFHGNIQFRLACNRSWPSPCSSSSIFIFSLHDLISSQQTDRYGSQFIPFCLGH
ncbi:hypothetical protein L218DRAFT_767430 [Marasmius fiardii PR-910]|nr:hypothetical protein L218DRAFT_767430 [Marasmius fiardii PR-910]